MQYKKIFNFKIPQFYFIVIIILLFSIIIFNLGLITYEPKYKEGITANELKQQVELQTKNRIDAATPVSMVLQKKFNISIKDSAEYTDEQIRSNTTFTGQNPKSTYLISSTSEETPSSNTSSEKFTINNNTTVTIPIETSKFNNYIVIAPDSKSSFPPNFTLTMINNETENGLQITLWGSTKSSLPNNGLIGAYNIEKTPYAISNFVVDSKNGVTIAGLNIGNNALNIFSSNDIYDNKYNNIGNVTQVDNVITINCTNAKGITGMLIYLGIPTKMQN
jgi:hypothetical protein